MGNFCDSFFKPMPILPQEEIVKSPKNDNSVKSNHDQKTPLNTSTSSDEFFDGHEIQETIYLNKPTKKKPTINDFALVRPIGKGAFGKVLLVNKKDKNGNNKLLAMKILNKIDIYNNNLGENLKLERKVLLEHSCVFLVKLKCAFQTGSKIYLVMEYLSGGSLASFLNRMKRFNEDLACFYASEIVLGLEYLHIKLKILYRDLKPENVLLDSSGHIKLTDFGLSKASNGKMSYTFAGTPEYVAPEVLTGKGYNFKADFWSLGVIIFEMLAGRTPFGDTTGDLAKTLIQVVQNKPKFPAFFNESSIDLIKKLLHEDPEKRLGSNGFNEIKNHAFFKRINWKNVENLKTKPPLIAVAKNKNLENINGIGNEDKVIESFGNVDMPNFSRISYDSNLQQSIRNILDER